MSDLDIDPELRELAQHLAEISQRAEINHAHKHRLGEELMRRHQELSAETTQRTAGRAWLGFAGLKKRLTLVAPAALASAVAAAVLLWALQISGAQNPHAAEAARLTNALVHSAPTVTSWQISLQQMRGNATSTTQCSVPLTSEQRLYIHENRAYLYSYGNWYRIVPTHSTARCPSEWKWAFAVLPSRLAGHKFSILHEKTVQGRQTEGIRYVLRPASGREIQATAWVEKKSGLVFRLERVVIENGRVIERDSADYRYKRSG